MLYHSLFQCNYYCLIEGKVSKCVCSNAGLDYKKLLVLTSSSSLRDARGTAEERPDYIIALGGGHGLEGWSGVVCEGVVECSVEEGGVEWCVREWWSGVVCEGVVCEGVVECSGV